MAKNESGGLTWTPCTVTLGELRPWERNPKRLSKAQAARLLASWETLGQFQTLAIGPAGEVYDGHQRLSALLKLHGPRYTVQALRSNRPLTERGREQIAVLSVTAVGSFDWDALAGWDASALTAWGLDADTLAVWNDDAANLRAMLGAESIVPPEVVPPNDFKEFDEDIETEHVCPKCGYRWSGGVNLDAEG